MSQYISYGVGSGSGGGSGSVTSVAMTVPSFLSVAGSPITTSGTLAVTLSGTALPVLNGGTGTTTSTGTGSTVLSVSPTFTGNITADILKLNTIQTTSASTVLDVLNRKLYWNDGTTLMMDFGGASPALRMYDSTGIKSVAWSSRVLYDSAGAGVNSINWGSRTLVDATPATAVDWGSRLLKNSSGTTILNWETAGAVTGTNSGDVTIGTANGLSIAGQALSMAAASGSTTGALSSTDWTTFNNKGAGSVTSVAMSVPAFLSISGSPITTSGTLAVTLSGTALPLANGGTGQTSFASGALSSNGTTLTSGTLSIGNGGTGQTTAAAAMSALSPITTTGDMIYSSSGTTNSRLAIGTYNQVIKAQGGIPTWARDENGLGPNYIANFDASIDTTTWVNRNWQQTVTITIASPGVFTVGSTTGMYAGMPISFKTSGALPTGLTASTTYYVTNLGTDGANKFRVSTSLGGSDLATSGTQSGTHTSFPLVPINAATVSVSGLTFSRSTSSPLRGSGSFSLVQTNSTIVGGQGIAYPFTIDSADQAKPLSITFDYNASTTFVASSGATGSDSDVEVAIWDVTNSTLIPVSPKVLVANGSNNFSFSGTFQTASNSTSYELVLFTPTMNANATGWTFKWDNVYVGPQKTVQGAAVTDAVAYTPTFTGFGTVVSINAYSRKDGDMLEFWGTATSGTPTATEARISLGYNAGNSNVTTDSGLPTLSVGGDFDRGAAAALSYATLLEASKTYITFGKQDGTNPMLAKVNGNALVGTGEVFSWRGRVKITGWSSNVQMSNDTDTRVVAVSYLSVTGSHTSSAAQQDVTTWVTKVEDTHAAFSSGVFTVPVSGDYLVSATLGFATNTTGFRQIYIIQNGTNKIASPGINGQATVSLAVSVMGIIKCVAGDTIKIGAYQNSGGTLAYDTAAANASLSISRLSGPATIAASESVSALYTGAPPTGTLTSAWNTTTFGTKVKDTHGAYSSGTYTVPVSGTYSISATTRLSGTYAAGNLAGVAIFVDGTINKSSIFYATAATQPHQTVTAHSIPLLAGQLVTIRSYNSGTSPAFTSAADENYFSLVKTGNY